MIIMPKCHLSKICIKFKFKLHVKNLLLLSCDGNSSQYDKYSLSIFHVKTKILGVPKLPLEIN